MRILVNRLENVIFALEEFEFCCIVSNEGIRIDRGPRGPDRHVIEGFSDGLVRLSHGHALRLVVTVFREPHEDGHRLKVEQASYQYQLDDVGDRWLFRYDYLRRPDEPHPSSHLHIRGPLERIHFPTGRVSLEAVLRLLIEQFDVPSNVPPDVWRTVLAASEREFERIASRPLSGPAA